MMIKYKQYLLKYIARKLTQLKSIKPIQSGQIELPLDTCIHYVSDTPSEWGIRRSHPLLQNSKSPVRVNHVTDLIIVTGNPARRQFNASAVLLKYFKSRPSQFTRVRKMVRTLKEARSVFVMDYSLLLHTHRYVGRLAIWEEQANIQATIWSGVRLIGTERQNLVTFIMPELLPAYKLFKKTPSEIPSGLLKQWEDVDALGLKSVWDLIESRDVVSLEVARHTTLVFIESGHITQVNLGLLYEWAEDNLDTTRRAIYAAWVNLFQLRTGVDTHSLETVKPAALPPGKESVVGATNLNIAIADLVAAGRMSTAEQKRIWTLSESYKTIPNPVGEGTLETMIVIKPEVLKVETTTATMSDIPGVLDKTMLRSSVDVITGQYVDDVMAKDIAAMTLAMQSAGLIIKDYKVERKIDAINDYSQYKVSVLPINGAPSTINFRIPTVKSNGEFIANGVKYRMDSQRVDLPFRKVASDKVALTSYYGKVFIRRSPKSAANYSRWIVSQLSRLAMDTTNTTFKDLVFSTSPLPKVSTPRGYSAIARTVSGFTQANYRFFFNYAEREARYGKEKVRLIESLVEGVVCGDVKGKDGYLLVMDWNNLVYLSNGNGRPPPVDTIPGILDPEMGEGPIEYVEMRVYGKNIPLAVAISYLIGINGLLSHLKVKHRWVPAGQPLGLTQDEIRIRFKDESLIYDRRDRLASLILAGFNGWKRATVKVVASDLNTKGSYGHFFELMGIGRHVIKEMGLMEKLFIDPITLELLKEMGEPTDWLGLQYRSAEALMDDSYTDEMDPSQMRIRGYERFSGMVYNRMVGAVREQRNTENPMRNKVDLPPSAVWSDILDDPSITLVEESNPIHNLKEKEGLTFTGQGGRTAKTMVGRSRLFNDKDVGTISEATPDSAKVAIKTYLTPNAKINSLRGTTEAYDKKVDGISSLVSTTALLSPSALMMDPKRTNMGSVQQSSMVASAGAMLTPLRTGYEQVIAIRCDDAFAYNAKGDGIVVAVDDDYLEIKFTDANGDKQKTGLKLGVVHGKSSGATIPHRIVTDLTAGHRFKADDILVWNRGYFQRDYLNPGGVSMKGGVMSRTVFMENPDTLEDSSAVSTALAGKLATPMSSAKTILLDFTQVISQMVKVGDAVNVDSVIMAIEDGELDGVVSEGDPLLALSKLTSQLPLAKVKGTVTRIETIYMGDVKEMHPSIAKLVRATNRRRVIDAERSNTAMAKTGEITEQTFINKNKVTTNTVAITIYIDKESPVTVGDKYVMDMASKSIAGRILEGDNLTEDGQAFDMTFAYRSISNRMVNASLLNGATNSALIALTKNVIEAYRS